MFPRRWPPIFRVLAAQGAAFLLLLAAAFLLPRHGPLPLWIWPLLQGLLAMAFSRGLGPFWLTFQVFLPFALFWQMGHRISPWLYPVLLAGLALIFGGGLLTRVPLYNSNRAAWRALLELVPESEGLALADLGAGLGGPLAFLARHRPGASFVGVEASPLVWLVAWLRTIPLRKNCRVRFGSLWRLPLGEFQIIYAFLSPVPMPTLWEKAQREMVPGSLLVSHTFEIPGVHPEREIPLTGRKDARLLIYRIKGP